MRTVKDLKKCIENLPDEMVLVVLDLSTIKDNDVKESSMISIDGFGTTKDKSLGVDFFIFGYNNPFLKKNKVKLKG